VSIGEPAEGDFVEVRPTGTKDTVFCSPNELTSTRPPRRRAQKSQPAPTPPEPPARRASPPPRRDDTVPAATEPARSAPDRSAERNGSAPPAAAERKPPRSRPVARPVEVTVTLSSTADGEWTVEVSTGRKRAVRPTPVQPAEVAKAARSLPPAVAEAIESSLAAARQRQIERVERLRAELDAAQQALKELSG
jgi:hypothetical protein